MNERIKELMLEAGKTIPGDKHIDADFCEKFAELIVAECADYCKGHILPKDVAEQNGLTYNDGVGDCAIGLEQHFGVEE